MKTKLSLVLIAVLIANLLLSGVVSAAPAQTEIYVSPIITETNTCSTMTFGVWVKNVVDLTAFHLEIDFDPGSVEVTEVVNGGFLGTPTESALFEPTNGFYEVTNSTGKILFGVAQQGTNGDPSPRNGDGKLIEITLKAKTPGDLVPFTINGAKSILVNWPDVMPIPFIVTGPGVVSTSSCAPTDITLTPNTVEDGKPAGTEVGTLQSIDPDSSYGWESFTYSLPASLGDNALFAISGDKVSTRFIADYGTRTSYTIQVRSTDAGGKTFTKQININVVDTVAPVMESVLPAEGAVVLSALLPFVLTVDAFDLNLYELEVDHNLAALPEFSVYASVDNVYGSPEAAAAFASAGVNVSYDATLQKWMIDFGTAVTDQFIANGGATFYLVLKDSIGNKWGSMSPVNEENTFAYSLSLETVAPELTITSVTADGTAMSGNLTDGYTLVTTNDPAIDHLLQMNATVSEPLANDYFGLTLIDSSVSATTLKAYYAARGVPEPYLTYLNGAADGTNPFVYIKGTTVKLVDAAKHDLGSTDVAMTIPDDFPLGTYTVQGVVKDLVGNETTVTFKLIVTGDRVAPVVSAMVAIGAGSFGNVTASGTTFTVAEGYTVASIRITISEPVTVDPGTEVTLNGVPYGLVTVSSDSLTLIVTPYPGNEVAAMVGPFTFILPTGSVKDLAGNALTALSATLNVSNQVPVAVNDAYSVNEDAVLNVAARGVLANDTDFNPLALTAVLVAGPSNGTLVLNVDGSFTYTPAANYNGTDSFTYKANDGKADSNTATVTISVTAVNDAPVADAKTITTAEDTAYNGAVSASDVDGNSLTFSNASDPANGTVVVNADGTFTYTPAANYNGPDSFTFKANDGTANSNVATVTISVTAVNDAPVADGKSITTAEDTPFNGSVTANDVEGDTLTFSKATDPAHGTVVVNADGTFTYTSAANYNGPDSFTFKTNDGTANSNVATVTISVTAVNDAPLAQGQSVTTAEDTSVAITLVATDLDGNPLTYSIVTGPLHGILSGTAPALTYTPTANYNGPDSFTFKATDGTSDSNIATVTITVSSVNNAPVAQGQSVTTAEDTAVAITLVATDVDGDTLTYSIVEGPAHGTFSGTAPVLTYTPAANYNGLDSFTFKAKDASLESNTATVTISVTAVNDAPVANALSITTAEDTAYNGAVSASDVDGNSLTFSKASNPANGTVVVNADGTFTCTPTTNYNGSDSFSFTVSDGTLSSTATVTISVTAVNDAPEANAKTITTAEDTAFNGSVTASDVERDPLTFSKVTDPANGTVVVNAEGTFTYTPFANYNGPDSFTFKANDGSLDSTPATVTITVTPVNDAPVANSQSVTTAEDTAYNGSLAANDVDLDILTYSKVTDPAYGTVVVNANGTFSYTPDANYNGPDSFTFKANDGTVDSNIASATITVTSVNDAPIAMDDFYTINEDTPLVVSAADGILKNDSDIDLNPMAVALLLGPTNGTLTLNEDGSFIYTPKPGICGQDTFTYRLITTPSVAVEGAWTAEAIVTITVNCAPTLAPIPDQVAYVGEQLSIQLIASDPDGDPLTFTLIGVENPTTKVDNDTQIFTGTPTESMGGTIRNIQICVSDGKISTPICQPVKITVHKFNPANLIYYYLPIISK